MVLYFFILRAYTLLAYQPGELPVPKKSKANQRWGNFTFGDFIADNWLYIAGILLMVVFMIIYTRENKKHKREEENKKD